MLFSSQATVIAYLSHATLALYGKKRALGRLELTADDVQNLEVVDVQKLQAHIAQFATQNKLSGQRVLLALAESAVFQRTITRTTPAADQAAIDDVKDKVPFEPEQKGFVIMDNGDQFVVFGTNKQLYGAVQLGLEKAGARLEAVVPASVYKIKDDDRLDHAGVMKLLEDKELTLSVDFLQTH